jgi:hypothetical protein
MEHPGPETAVEPDDGVAELFGGAPRDVPRPRALRQVLVVVLGWLVVIGIICAALVVASPVLQAVVVGLVKALAPAGSAE